jgi:hypothetical protein
VRCRGVADKVATSMRPDRCLCERSFAGIRAARLGPDGRLPIVRWLAHARRVVAAHSYRAGIVLRNLVAGRAAACAMMGRWNSSSTGVS